jgi:hypothetical protein
VRPRVGKVIAKYSTGTAEERARNFVIEGDNLQAMATLYKERGLVDLILTDPPYNTGQDFRYNDRWEEDPNDPGMGELVSEEDGGRHTKWMRFMWPRLQMMKSMLKPAGVLAICIDHRELFSIGPDARRVVWRSKPNSNHQLAKNLPPRDRTTSTSPRQRSTCWCMQRISRKQKPELLNARRMIIADIRIPTMIQMACGEKVTLARALIARSTIMPFSLHSRVNCTTRRGTEHGGIRRTIFASGWRSGVLSMRSATSRTTEGRL